MHREVNIESLRQVFVVLMNDQPVEYYFDYQNGATLGRFMDEGWGHFYQPHLRRWEFINMKHIVKVYYGK
ncbi:hypothetical protein N178_12560 [Priestia aryabhattai B8W22]|nr:hypothetical protein N178_12560 [Priestia aryabhattai B8W22]